MKEKQPAIAIVGVGALFPGSLDAAGFWKDILAGRDLMTDIPPTHWRVEDYYDPDPQARDKTYARRGAFLRKVDFDPMAWGIPPSTVPATDTAQLLSLIVAQRVLEDACNGQFSRIDRDRTSVILGVTSAQELLGSMVSRLQRPIWAKALRDSGLPEAQVEAACERIASHYVEWQESTFPGVLGNVVAGRIANRLDLGGTNCVTDAACASTFAAVSMAVNELHLGECDLAITGGVDTMNDIFMYMCFSKTPALSPTEDCRPFSDRADGTMLGEGIGMVALKRLEDAERAGDRIYALLKGVGSSSDGRAKSVYAPLPAGQAKALRRAYAQAGFGPETVELVEAHGTGTKAGDAAEFEGLRTVFQESGRNGRPWCALGSVKSQIGHTKAAAGAAGLFKAVMALHHKVLPPTIKVERPNPALAIDESPFYLPSEARPWVRDPGHPRRAGVSSFGFGGSNFHLVLEEYEGEAPRPLRARAAGSELVLLGADDPATLAERCEALRREAGREGMLAHAARETQESYDAEARFRLAVVASSDDDLVEKLGQAAALAREGRAASTPSGIDLGTGAFEGGIAFLFPGQGSQYVGMGASLACLHDAARSAWDLAARHPLRGERGERLHDVAFPAPAFTPAAREAQAARLTATEWAQPAIAAASLALLRVLRAAGLEPQATAGHSFGEVTALHAAGVLSAEDLLAVARRRGELMAEAASIPGAMTAVFADAAAIRERIAAWGIDVVVANHNAPAQLVLSGSVEAIAAAEKRLESEGIRAKRLPVATAFHSPIVSPALGAFEKFLRGVELSPSRIDVYAGAEAAPYAGEPDAVRTTLAEQIAKPVRFVDVVSALHARGIRAFIEVGPDGVLTQLVSRILEGKPHAAIATDRRGQEGSGAFHGALARLAALGVRMDLRPLWAPFERAADPRGRTRPRIAIELTGSNYGKPYPPPPGSAASAAMPAALPAPARVAQGDAAPLAHHPPPPKPSSARRQTEPSSARRQTEPSPARRQPQPSSFLRQPKPSFARRQNQNEVHVHVPVPTGFAPGWLEAYAAVQRETADAHAAYQQAMAESHGAFLRTAEASIAALASIAGAEEPELQRMPEPEAIAAAAPAPAERLDGRRESGRPPLLVPLGTATGASRRPARAAGSPVIAREVVVLVDAEPAGLAIAGLRGAQRVVVTDDGGGTAEALVRALGERGIAAEAAAVVPPDADAVIFLGGLREVRSRAEAIEVNREAFRAARAVAPRLAAEGGVFVTVQDTGGDLGFRGSARAWLGGLTGLVKSAALEWPRASLRAIDVERGGRPAEAVAGAIARELLEGGGEIEVGLRASGRRSSIATRPAPLETAAMPLAAGDLVVVSGGARGVTAASAVALAAATGCRLLLLGRTPLEDEPPGLAADADVAALKAALATAARERGERPSPAAIGREAERIAAAREVRSTLAAVAGAGGEARYVAVDVTDPEAVGRALAAARVDWGPVRGLVHGAGVLADKLIAEKTDAQLDAVLGTKVRGLEALLAATEDDPLRALVVFSSVAGRSGNAGQADYAMANEVLARVAALERARRGGQLVAKALDWGPWRGGMVTDALASHFEGRGVPLLPLEAGARQLALELGSAGREVEVVLTGKRTGEEGAGAAAPRGLGAPAAEVRLEAVVGRATCPELDGHRVKGVAVLPAAYALEYMARAAAAARPGAKVLGCRGLRVLRGVRLERFDLPGEAGLEHLEVRAREALDGSVEAEIATGPRGGLEGSPRYAAVFDLGPELETPEAPPVPSASEPSSSDRGPIYGGTLFHTGAFRMLRSIDAVSEDGLEATLAGAPGCGLGAAARRTDPALVDGALQLALLFTERALGGPSLPTSIAAVRLFVAGPVEGPVRASLRGGVLDAERATSDVVLSRDGVRVAEVLGIETHRLPGGGGA